MLTAPYFELANYTNDRWKALVPMWALEVLDFLVKGGVLDKDWRKNFLGARVFERYDIDSGDTRQTCTIYYLHDGERYIYHVFRGQAEILFKRNRELRRLRSLHLTSGRREN